MPDRVDLWDNPMGTDGFEFVEFTGPDPAALDVLFRTMGFSPVAQHRSKTVTLYRQGGINFILNAEKQGQPGSFAQTHGPSINALAFRVEDAGRALHHAEGEGAKVHRGAVGPMELNLPAIEGIGGSLLYMVDRYGPHGEIYDIDFLPIAGADPHPVGHGLETIDHLTHNVVQGNMATWSDFYTRLFNFREVRYFDIEGKLTGLRSKAMTSPDGKIRIPINESADDKSQIVEYLNHYKGEGVQHVALSTRSIVTTVEAMRAAGVPFLTTPDTYYEMIDQRIPGHGLDLEPLRRNHILVDGAPTEDQGLLLQIFTENLIGPIFFELIERRGNEGFGEGNFKALFESMELDQIRRGVLK
ncbi:MAG: 4-hydroxyphenylpyruvate dioxygenase [Rhodospirillaceae bacterium]